MTSTKPHEGLTCTPAQALDSTGVHYSRGSSTLEFLFCAPLLLIIMYTTMELNERVEHRVNATIAAGNAAWLADPNNQADLAKLTDLATGDVLGTRADGGNGQGVGLGSGAVSLEDKGTVMAYSDSRRTPTAYHLEISQARSGASDALATNRAATQVGSTSDMDKAVAKLNQGLSAVETVFQDITSPGTKVSFLAGINLLPPPQPVEEQVLTWSLSDATSSNKALDAITGLSNMISHDTGANLATFDKPASKVLAAKATFLRRDPMYHPDYKNEALYGLVFGSLNSTFDDFNDNCFMAFQGPGDNQCSEHNGFVDVVATAHTAVQVAKTYMECTCVTPFCANVFIEVGIDCAIQAVENAVVDGLKTVIGDKINSLLTGAAAPVFNDIKAKITEAISGPPAPSTATGNTTGDAAQSHASPTSSPTLQAQLQDTVAAQLDGIQTQVKAQITGAIDDIIKSATEGSSGE